MDKQNTNSYISRFVKIYPFLKGFTDDLLFFIAIDTLFFTVVKGLNAQQIVMLTTISSLFSITCRLFFIEVIRKIGNTSSVRLGMLLLLLSAICITFGPNYYILVLGEIIYEIAWIFKDMENVMLKNNLAVIGKEDEYAKIANNGMIIYAFLTFVVSLCSGFIFNINPYLPMLLCILICAIACIMYFYMRDVSDNNYTAETKPKENDTPKKKIKFSKIMLLFLISYAILYGVITLGQQNSKLLIQYELSDIYNITKVSMYLSAIIAASRVSRLLSTILFGQIYPKLQNKTITLLSVILFISFIITIIGYFLPIPSLKFILMTIGFCLILSVRDPFRLFAQDLVLKMNSPKEHQIAISYIQFARKTGTTISSLVISAVLLKWDLIYVISGITFLAFLQVLIAIKLYNLLMSTK